VQDAKQKAYNDQTADSSAESTQCCAQNTNAPVRIKSYGDDGDVKQANLSGAISAAGNKNETTQNATQDAGSAPVEMVGICKDGCGGHGFKMMSADECKTAKAKAADVAKGAANPRIIANEISVQPVGSESEAKDVASNLDDAIEKNYKAALIASGLEKQNLSFKAKNGVLSLTGSVHNVNQRQQAGKLAAGIPNVQQVLNQIEVRR
jgi:osmotically-inducible protein OsmY